MANRSQGNPLNAPRSFCVDTTCLDHDQSKRCAPMNYVKDMGENGEAAEARPE